MCINSFQQKAAKKREFSKIFGNFQLAQRLGFLVLLLLFIASKQLIAAPHFGEAFTYQQPDGETFEVHLYGDEFFAYVETADGYLVIRDPSNGIFCYAKVSPNGADIISTGVRVGLAKPAGLTRKQRLKRGMAMKKSLGNRNLLGVDEKGRRNSGKKLKVGKNNEILNVVTDEAAPQSEQGDGSTTPSDIIVLPAPPPGVTLNQRVGLVLLASFPDRPADVTKTVANVDDYCNAESYTADGNATSVYGYFKMQSNGKLSYKNNVTAWFTAANPRSYYTDNTVAYATRARELIKEGLAVLKAQGFDFTQCDGNNDGKLDGVNCFYAGARVNAWSEGIWPHQSSSSWTGLTGTGLSSTSYDYQITDMPASLPIGTFCHENGHMICDFPDLYAYDTNAANLGSYSLMASSGSTHPRHVDPYLKIHAGWADVVDLTSASQQLCAVQQDRNFFYRYRNPAKSTEYFLFEVRGTAGYEGVWNGAGATNPANGLVIYHALQGGSNTNSTIITADVTTNYTKPYELMVVEALPSTAVVPWYDDPTPGTNDAFTASGVSSISDITTPVNLNFWAADGRTLASGANINTISAAGQTMTFIAGTGPLPATPATNVSVTQFQPNVDFGENAANHTFSVFNSGGGTLSYTVSGDAAWLSCTPTSGTATTEADLITVSYTTAALAAGNYAATISINGGSAGNKTITVTLTVNPRPTLAAAPGSLSVAGITGTTGPTATFNLSNTGGGTVGYALTKTQAWLSLDRASGTVEGEQDLVTATFNATSLAPGVYTDTITVTAAEATNSPLTIPVSFTVLNSDMIVTSPNGSEQWVKGETRSVTWISSLGGNAKIELFKGGVLNSTIVASTPNTGSYSWVIPGAQAAAADYTVKITSIETPAKTDSSNANFSIFPTLADALDATSLTWTTSGNQPWAPQITTSQDGVDAAQSGTIGDSQSSSVETTLTGPGTLTYWWKISSELNYDYLKFYLNGIEQTGSLAKISGEIAWIQKTVTIPTGSQTIKWTYSKDGSAASGSDAAWVDGVVFTPASSPEIAVEQPVGTDLTDGGAEINFGSVSLGSSSSPSTFTIRNTGTANLTGIAVTKTGTHNADYAIGALGATTLAPGASTTFTVTFTPGGSGSRVAALQIASNDANENPFDINLAGTGVPLGTLDVTSGGLASTGTYGGSFSPSSKIYTLTNVGSTSINWTAGTTQGWVTLSAASGTLAAGATTTVTTSINANANTLAPNSYSDTVTFTNTTNGFGNATRAVDLTVNALSATVDLSNLQQTYNGSLRPVTVTTTPSGLAHSVTYNGSSTVPTIGGTYAVVATITEPNYAGSASGNLVISYTVSYQANGNTGGTAPADQTKYQDVNLALATNSGNLNKTDYSLICWNTAADGSGTDYALGGTYSSNASLVLYAKWAPGADGTWVQTTAGPFDWSTSGNWSGGTIAAGADRTASFTSNITAAQVVNLDSARTIGNITFTDSTTASHDLTISGANPLTLARTTGMPTINVTNRTLTISSQISGNGGLKKAGAGNLTLSGTNDYTGGTVISAGTLAIALDSNLGAASGGIIFDGTSSLSLGVTTLAAGRTITINNGVTATFTQGTNGQKTVLGSLTGAGTLVFNTTTGLSFQNASNSFSGVINATTGNTLSYGLEFASIGDGVGAGLINLNNGSFRWINTSGGATTLSNRQFALSGTTSGGTISALGNTGSILAITKDLLVTGDGNKTFTLAGTNTGANRFAGNISNGSVGGTTDIISLTKSEAGTWALSGTNTYSGDTNLVASGTTGRLVFQGSQSLSPNTKLVFAQASSSVQSARFLDDGVGTINFARPIEFGGTNTSQSLNLFVGNNSTANLGSSLGTTTGSTIQVGNITFTSTAADTATTTINVTGTNNYRLQTGIITLNNLVTRTANNTTVTAINPTTANMTVAAITMATGNTGTVNDGIPVVRLDGTSTDNVVTGVISNATDYLSGQALSLQKQNTSTWTLSGANAYTGTTTVTAGKLFINGDQSLATGNVSVASAATLGGSGKIGGSVTIATGGKLEFDISTSAAGHNPLDISSGKDFIFSGTSTLTITSSVSLAAGTYTLITGGNSITGVAPATLNVSVPVGGVASTYISGNSLMLKIVGPIDHFAISPISSPRTVNTLITGITITAQDTANQTIATFNGTVSFGGTAGVTGTSASFVNGVLSGVSITPSVLGDNRTFTVNDGSGHVGTATFNVQSAAYSGWVSTGVSQFENTFTDTALTSNPDGDNLNNLQEFAFGLDPTSSTTSTLGFTINGEVTQPGVPAMMNFAATGQPAEYRAVFARRKDYVAANVAYTVVFTADLQVWTASSTNLNVVTDPGSLGELEAVSIPFPATVPVQGGGAQQAPKFFRVGVAGN